MLSPGLQTLPPPSQALLPVVSSLSITNTATLVWQTTWQLTSQVRQRHQPEPIGGEGGGVAGVGVGQAWVAVGGLGDCSGVLSLQAWMLGRGE